MSVTSVRVKGMNEVSVPLTPMMEMAKPWGKQIKQNLDFGSGLQGRMQREKKKRIQGPVSAKGKGPGGWNKGVS